MDPARRRSRRLPRVLFLALASSLVAAGCLGPGDEPAPQGDDPAASWKEEWALSAIPWGEGHDHGDHSHHENLTTPNWEIVGFDPLVTDSLGTSATGMGCGGIGSPDGERRIAVAHTFSTEVAFVVADVTDPANPVILGEYVLENVHAWDATVTPDGKHVLIGAYPPALKPGWSPVPGADALALAETGVPAAALDTLKVQPKFRDACTGEVRNAGPEASIPLAPAVIMVGIEDPTNPVLEDVKPQPVLGPHSVSSALVDGTLYAMASVTNLVHQVSYYTIFEVVDTPAGSVLDTLSVIPAPGLPEAGSLNGHVDMEVHKHPVTGQVLAYLANWDEGMAIYDLANPRVPLQVGTWKDAEHGAIHETLPLDDVRDGKHYTIVGQEVGEPVYLPSGLVFILDTTDPANPVEVARWTIPVKPKWDGGLQFSTHYVEVVGDTLFVANYHGGLWAVDITDPAAPGAIGLFVPSIPSPEPHPAAGGPSIGDVLAWPDGTLTTWDNSAGIYSLRFHADQPAPKPEPWDLG